MSNNNNKPSCKVCKDAGKSETEYRSHWPKNQDGKTVCPTLLAQECRYCRKSGHTVKYCQVLVKENNNARAKNENKVSFTTKSTKSTKSTSIPLSNFGSFALLIDDDCNTTQKRAPAVLKEEFPALSSQKRALPTPVTEVSFATIAANANAIKVIGEKQTCHEERLGKAISAGMVVIERGSQGIVMTRPPKSEALFAARERHNYECFKGINGKGWADTEDSDDDEFYYDDNLMYV